MKIMIEQLEKLLFRKKKPRCNQESYWKLERIQRNGSAAIMGKISKKKVCQLFYLSEVMKKGNGNSERHGTNEGKEIIWVDEGW